MKKVTQNKKGFTLVEALVAVSILLIGVTAAFGTAQLGLSSTSSVRNRVISTYLAQEALESVKNLKDSNLQSISLDGENINWLEGLTKISGGMGPCVTGGAACGYDFELGLFGVCSALNGCSVFDNGNFFRQTSANGLPDTGFVRRIYIVETVPDKEAQVTVEISRSSGFPTFRVVAMIYNWF